MSSIREKDLWKELDKRNFWIALLVIVILIIIYLALAYWMDPSKSLYSIARGLVLAIIPNLIPVFLLFMVSYALLQRIRELRSEKETEELASKVADILKSELGAAIKASHTADTSEGRLIIVCAKYGAQDKWNDVTDCVRSKIVAERVEMPVNNDYFGPDPIKKAPKEVKVDYFYAGRKYSKTVPEHADLILP